MMVPIRLRPTVRSPLPSAVRGPRECTLFLRLAAVRALPTETPAQGAAPTLHMAGVS